MATTTLGRRPRLIGPVSAVGATGCQTSRVPLAVRGTLPADLDGCFLQARPHPAGAAAPVVEGIRVRGGAATRFRAVEDGSRPCPFGPVPSVRGTGGPLAARPVADGVEPFWHTVVAVPRREHGEHLVLDGKGRVLHRRSFPLAGDSLVQVLAVTPRHVIVLDLPVAYCRAADLVGERDPYVWNADRPARIGLMPRCPEQVAAPVWFTVEQGLAADVIGAHHEPGRVVVDLLWHRRSDRSPAEVAAAPAPVVRWTLDLHAGVATSRRLTGPVGQAARGRDHGRVHTVSETARGAELATHDAVTGREDRWVLGPGLVTGRPVLVPAGRRGAADGDRWLLLPVERVATRCQELLVLDPADVAAGPVAVVSVPASPRPSTRAMWLDLGGRTAVDASA